MIQIIDPAALFNLFRQIFFDQIDRCAAPCMTVTVHDWTSVRRVFRHIWIKGFPESICAVV